MTNMPSMVIRHYRYHPSQRRLEIIFATGRRYFYHEVPREIFAGLEEAFSKGEFFNAHIRDQFSFSREREGVTANPVENIS